MNIDNYKAEDFINLIEQERFDKISNYGMELIAIKFRKLQNKGQSLPIDNVSNSVICECGTEMFKVIPNPYCCEKCGKRK